MAVACILVFAAIAAAPPLLPATSIAPAPAAQPQQPPAREARATERDDPPRWAAGYRTAQIDLRWQAADADANTIVLIAPRRDALQARIERASLIAKALDASQRVGLADVAGVADPRCPGGVRGDLPGRPRREPLASPRLATRFTAPCLR